MTDHDDLLTEIGSDLDVEPSREFAVGVHALVRKNRRRGVTIRWALATAASIGLVAIVVSRPSIKPSSTVPSTSEPSSPVAVVKTEPQPVASVPIARVPVIARSAASVGVRTVAEASPALTTAEPPLEVITNQGEVLRALWANYQSKPRVLVVVDGDAGVDARPIVVEPIVVPSIVVKELGSKRGRLGSTDVPRIIRRSNATGEKK